MTESAALQLRKYQRESPWTTPEDEIVIGKDIMELLSNSMYVDPMSIYREYIQNAADAIDIARLSSDLTNGESGRVSIEIDSKARSLKIRDNGTGIPTKEFISKLTAFGASSKRGTNARGFRGVGRLAGMGYCQQVVFRSRATNEANVNELRWDCRKLKTILRSTDFKGTLFDLVRETVSVRSIQNADAPEHFFEVELEGVVRHKNDSLLDSQSVYSYLSQVAPVPFSPEFKFREEIDSRLKSSVRLANLHIEISGIADPVYRPHRDTFEVKVGTADEFSEIEFIEIPGNDNECAALGWLLHHGYMGAIPSRTGVAGLRFRSGNIQVGAANILEEIFPESRFNSWSVGELHVIDQRIMPNGRRDHFDQNIHFHNVLNHVVPVARTLSSRARASSMRRKCLRDFELQTDAARKKLTIIKQGSLPQTERERLAYDIRKYMDVMEQIARRTILNSTEQDSFHREVSRLRADLEKILDAKPVSSSLSKLSRGKRETYQKVFSMIYECAPNEGVAKAIVDKMLRRIR